MTGARTWLIGRALARRDLAATVATRGSLRRPGRARRAARGDGNACPGRLRARPRRTAASHHSAACENGTMRRNREARSPR
ncbi:glutamyl-tRNA amidotransferase [Burkholderia pseudomallei]|nr:glutamyl-tRNA amidotransferase [Burkholderia pseudomallei]OMX10930.1 glutamyl-tRNA amidotransferase [Burkholderia pseudomallei]OMY08946.1 glutamyl-tRNA amidotransferase [Burkholderia pseudomallei]OMY09554.1 glutamyl-tRNA amidotransferase [Burkholderia pseudomallei]OMY24293.1 glutamyl-tRNA amidotransferase [Burkholderia pseudomallei]